MRNRRMQCGKFGLIPQQRLRDAGVAANAFSPPSWIEIYQRGALGYAEDGLQNLAILAFDPYDGQRVDCQ